MTNPTALPPPDATRPFAVPSTGSTPAGLYRDPTAQTAVSRASKRSRQAVPVPELRTRLCRAIGRADGHGALLIAGHLARSTP